MIERLMNQESRYGEPEYSKLERQITEVQQGLSDALDAKGRENLERLSELYIRQSNVLLNDVFADGFCTAVEMMLDFLRRRNF